MHQIRHLRYEIFAYEDVYADIAWYSTDFGDNEAFREYIQKIKNASIKDTGIPVETKDKIVTLSTCSSADRRFVVYGVLVDER